jgi:hypothetical protein
MGVSVSVYVLKQLHSSGARALLNRTNGTRRRKEGERRDLADTESSCQQSTDPRDGGGRELFGRHVPSAGEARGCHACVIFPACAYRYGWAQPWNLFIIPFFQLLWGLPIYHLSWSTGAWNLERGMDELRLLGAPGIYLGE